MAEPGQSNLTNPDFWIRLLYMVLFWFLSWLARAAVAIIALVQAVLVLINDQGHPRLRNLGRGIARWTEQNYLFLTFATEEKPYPFQDWPAFVDDVVTTSTDSAPIAAESATDNSATDDVIVVDAADETAQQPDGEKGGTGFGNIREP